MSSTQALLKAYETRSREKMKTREQVEALKKNWISDPCWDIETTEGFSEYEQELKDFRINSEAAWRTKEYNRIYQQAVSLGIENLGNKNDEPNLELTKYLMALERRIQSLETIVDKERGV